MASDNNVIAIDNSSVIGYYIPSTFELPEVPNEYEFHQQRMQRIKNGGSAQPSPAIHFTELLPQQEATATTTSGDAKVINNTSLTTPTKENLPLPLSKELTELLQPIQTQTFQDAFLIEPAPLSVTYTTLGEGKQEQTANSHSTPPAQTVKNDNNTNYNNGAKVFACTNCNRKYQGKNARSILRRHLKEKHGIEAPRGTRWDNDPNRPKTDEERRQRMLQSKRKWAQKARARKNALKASSAVPQMSNPGTPKRTDDNDEDNINKPTSTESPTTARAASQLLYLKTSSLPLSSTTTTSDEESPQTPSPTDNFFFNDNVDVITLDTVMTGGSENDDENNIVTSTTNNTSSCSNYFSTTTLPSINSLTTSIATPTQRSSPCHYAYTQQQPKRFLYGNFALRIIQSTIENGYHLVDLSYLKLRELPIELAELRYHVVLDPQTGVSNKSLKLFLAANKLCKLPGWLWDMNNLKVLSLRNNKLRELPPEIGLLSNLVELSVGNNLLKYLPSEILRSPKLDILNIDPNPFLSPNALIASPLSSQSFLLKTHHRHHQQQLVIHQSTQPASLLDLVARQCALFNLIAENPSKPELPAHLLNRVLHAKKVNKCAGCCGMFLESSIEIVIWKDFLLDNTCVPLLVRLCSAKCWKHNLELIE
ncbi:2120_t:CDS:2 [Ambispora gerdemannii]|uniref:2120_t:CDS:1 n=1 Tax=Ambispora gerdemannii TaxID=144530 RepID=A0A9N9CKW4_9GLOM|nr:2120_t:CDS:2 [Ambispora gerdemannii]